MLFAIIILLTILFIFLCGGNLNNLSKVKIKSVWLVFIALALKIILFSNLQQSIGITEKTFPIFYSISLFLVVFFIALNINLKGFFLLGLGSLSNALVIVLNGGYMPVKEEYVPMVATADDLQRIQEGLPATNFIVVNQDTLFPFLADIFLMPDWMPLSKVFSVGDVLITIGGLVFLFYYSRVSNN